MGAGLTTIQEGKVRFRAPTAYANSKRTGPGTKQAPGFYNPAMVNNRSSAVLIIRIMLRRWQSNARGTIRILDAMSATGVRGMRIIKEGISPELKSHPNTKPIIVVFNDVSKESVDLIRSNLARFRRDCKKHSGLPPNVTLKTTSKDINNIPLSQSYHYIDLDPFGSPMPYIARCIDLLHRGGIIGVTATDTAALFGTYPQVSRRRYMAITARVPFNYEMGIRTLISAVIRVGAIKDTALTPLFSYYDGHYLRAYFLKDTGAGKTDKVLKALGYIMYNRKTGRTTVLPSGGYEEACLREIGTGEMSDNYAVCGPLYLGPLWDRKLTDKIYLTARDGGRCYAPIIPLLERITEEYTIDVPYYYRTDTLASLFKRNAQKSQAIIDELRSMGYMASRTHFHPAGIRTNAGVDTLTLAF